MTPGHTHRIAAVLAAVALGVALATAVRGGQAEGAARPDRFDAAEAWRLVELQVAAGARPAGSVASSATAARLASLLPGGRFQEVGAGLRNVIGTVAGRDRDRLVVVGAHYDTKDEPGIVGANDNASGAAVVVQLARTVQPRELGPTVAFVLFDGEESPAGTSVADFERRGLRGSRVAARTFADAEAMILLDMVGDRDLRLPREGNSDAELWSRLREAARAAGTADVFPDETRPPIVDDHVPFLRAGVPAIDVIDFTFPCWHRPCDDLAAVSPESLDVVGETVLELLRLL